MPSATLVYGFWGQNIGNAFFNLGGRHQLDAAIGRENVHLIQDAPAYWTLHRKRSGNFRNWWGTIDRISTDWLILQGPLLTDYVGTIWDSTFASLARRGVKVGFIGTGFFQYNEEEIQSALSFIRRHECIRFIASRDQRTFKILTEARLDRPLFDGIDSAFFSVPELNPQRLHSDPFVVLNFDLTDEPVLHGPRTGHGFDVAIDGHGLGLTPRRARTSRQTLRYLSSVGSAVSARRRPRRWGPFEIVRTDHRTNPHLPFRTYGAPNSVAADEPYTYATLYANARAVLSDRVHAVALSHTLGTPAFFVGSTPRSGLLERVGTLDPVSGLLTSTVDLADLRKAQSLWLARQLGS